MTTAASTASRLPRARLLARLLPLAVGMLALALGGCSGERSASGPTRDADGCCIAAKDGHDNPENSSPAASWKAPGMHVRLLNPGAKHLDAIVTRDTFNRLFPSSVWFQEGDIVGMYNRETKMTFMVVSEHTFAAWNDELSAIAERLCHEKAHRADDLYDGDPWSELRDTSAPGLSLDTHHFGHEKEDTTAHTGIYLTATASGTAVAMNKPLPAAGH